MKKSLLFLPLLGLASNVAAQELRGVVTDAEANVVARLRGAFADAVDQAEFHGGPAR